MAAQGAGREDPRRRHHVHQVHPQPDRHVCAVRPRRAELSGASRRRPIRSWPREMAQLEELAQDHRRPGRRAAGGDQDAAVRRATGRRSSAQTVLDKDDPGAVDRCKKITAAWVEMGGNQDHLAGECRWAVKFLRQRAGLMMAQDPRLAEYARRSATGRRWPWRIRPGTRRSTTRSRP